MQRGAVEHPQLARTAHALAARPGDGRSRLFEDVEDAAIRRHPERAYPGEVDLHRLRVQARRAVEGDEALDVQAVGRHRLSERLNSTPKEPEFAGSMATTSERSCVPSSSTASRRNGVNDSRRSPLGRHGPMGACVDAWASFRSSVDESGYGLIAMAHGAQLRGLDEILQELGVRTRRTLANDPLDDEAVVANRSGLLSSDTYGPSSSSTSRAISASSGGAHGDGVTYS